MHKYVEVKYISPEKGKGLFAKRAIKKYTRIESAHIILLHNKDYEIIQNSSLYDYVFTWDDPQFPDHMNAIAFSICEFMNHSFDPNVKYTYDYDTQTIEFKAIKNINQGEELTINYNGRVNDRSSVWFKMV